MKTLADERWRTDVLRRLRTVRPDSGRRWGRMSAHQMICHLGDGCRMAIGTKRSARAPGVALPMVIKWIALYLPVRWPPGIKTTPELDAECDGTRPAAFAADVAALEQLLHEMTTRGEGLEWPAHPVFGRMSRADWLRWGYLHADHHLRQFGA